MFCEEQEKVRLAWPLQLPGGLLLIDRLSGLDALVMKSGVGERVVKKMTHFFILVQMLSLK